MKVEKINPIDLDKKVAIKQAKIIIKEQLKEDVKEIDFLGGGSFGRAYSIRTADDKKVVLKFLRARNMLDHEVASIELLAQNCSVKFPSIIFERHADDEIPVDCYCMELIDGRPAYLSPKLLLAGRAKRLAFADSVVTGLHSIHCNTSDKFGNILHPDCDSWLDYYKPFARQVLDKAEELYLEGALDKKIITTMRLAWEKFDIIFSEPVTTACLIHGDLNMMNIMVQGKKLIAFIDPLNTIYADSEYDLFQFDNFGKRFYLRKAYTDKYGASKFCDAKCAFYGLWNEVFCFIKSGTLVSFIMRPLITNMRKTLAKI